MKKEQRAARPYPQDTKVVVSFPFIDTSLPFFPYLSALHPFINLSWCPQKVLLVILNAVVDVDVDAVATVVLDVAAVIVDAAALIAVAGVAALIVDVVALTVVAGVVALIADAGDPEVLLLAAAPFVAGDHLLSLVHSLPLSMSKPSASNVQDMGQPGEWSRSTPIISRPIWIRGSSTITTVCASLPTRKNALNRSSLVLPPVVGKHDPSYTCTLLIIIHHSHFT